MIRLLKIAIISMLFFAFAYSATAQGTGTISTLDQWKSSAGSITQNIANKLLRLTGYNCTTKTNGGVLTTDASGNVVCDDDNSGAGGGGSFPFSADNNYGQVVYSTSTPTLWFKSGLFASSTSYFVNLFTTNASTTNLTISGVTSSLLKTSANGLVQAAIAGTDYVANVTGDWTGTLDTYNASDFFARANHTGTQLASTISDFATAARALFSSTATGLTYTAGTGVFSLTSGYVIPLVASTTEWASFYLTPSTRISNGAYLSWVGNTLNALGLATTSIDTSVELSSIITDETGTGSLVFNASPTLTGTTSINSFTATTSTTTNATTTNFRVSNGLSFGGVIGTTWASFCTSITGSADLCDGSDASGGGGGTVNSGLAGQVPYYEAPGTTLTATSAILIDETAVTFSPASGLGSSVQITGNGSYSQIEQLSNGGALLQSYLSDGSSYFNLRDVAGAEVYLDPNFGSYITGNGNFGLGTSTPASKLSVAGSAWINGNATATNLTATGTFRGAGLSDCDADNQTVSWDITTGLFGCGDDDNSGGGGGGASDFTFGGSNYGTSTAATNTPIQANGGIFASSTSHFTDLTFDTATATNKLLTGWVSAPDGNGLYLSNFDQTWSVSVNSSNLVIGNSNNQLFLSSGGSFLSSDARLDLFSGNNENILLEPNGTGKVGISSSTPSSLLSVAGDAWFEGIATSAAFAATSQTASSSLPRLVISTALTFVSDFITDITGFGLAVLNGSLGLDTTGALDEECLTYEDNGAGADGIEWQTCGGGGGTPGGSDTQIQFNDASAFGGAVGFVWNKTLSLLGVGSTTPSAKVAIEGGTWDTPAFRVASTTGNSSDMFAIHATTTSLIANRVKQSSNRIAIGNYLNGAGIVQSPYWNLTNYGTYRQEGWLTSDCSGVGFSNVAALSADGPFTPCPTWAFMEDAAGTTAVGAALTDGGYYYNVGGVTGANDGAGVFLGTAAWVKAATNTPIIDITTSINGAATTTRYYVGFTNTNPAGTTYETHPTIGCFVYASSTQANFIFENRSSATAYSWTNTGIASTSVTNNYGAQRRIIVSQDAFTCSAAIQGTWNQPFSYFSNSTNIATTTALSLGFYSTRGTASVGTQAATFRISDLWASFRKYPLPL
jgi:hypothetical protein